MFPPPDLRTFFGLLTFPPLGQRVSVHHLIWKSFSDSLLFPPWADGSWGLWWGEQVSLGLRGSIIVTTWCQQHFCKFKIQQKLKYRKGIASADLWNKRCIYTYIRHFCFCCKSDSCLPNPIFLGSIIVKHSVSYCLKRAALILVEFFYHIFSAWIHWIILWELQEYDCLNITTEINSPKHQQKRNIIYLHIWLIGYIIMQMLYKTRPSKLCEFCIKSCAERRKMTVVNWVN